MLSVARKNLFIACLLGSVSASFAAIAQDVPQAVNMPETSPETAQIIEAAATAPIVQPGTAKGDTLENRLVRLERDLMVLQRRLYKQDVALPPATVGAEKDIQSQFSRLYLEISDIEDIAKEMTGQVETLSFQLSQQKARMDRLTRDLDFRLGELEKALGAAPGQRLDQPLPTSGQPKSDMPPVKLSAPMKAPTPKSTIQAAPLDGAPAPLEEVKEEKQPTAKPTEKQPPQTMYREAYGLLRQGDYAQAELALADFLKEYPGHDLSGNAQYWLGETYYVRGDYEQAAVAFADGYKKYKTGKKGPDSLLKLGLSMAALKKKDEACAAFAALPQAFPDASKTVLARGKQEASKLSCK